jgi:hypothetical protein
MNINVKIGFKKGVNTRKHEEIIEENAALSTSLL